MQRSTLFLLQRRSQKRKERTLTDADEKWTHHFVFLSKFSSWNAWTVIILFIPNEAYLSFQSTPNQSNFLSKLNSWHLHMKRKSHWHCPQSMSTEYSVRIKNWKNFQSSFLPPVPNTFSSSKLDMSTRPLFPVRFTEINKMVINILAVILKKYICYFRVICGYRYWSNKI